MPVDLHGRVSHIRSKQRRTLSEPLQAIDRAVKDPGHCERVIRSVPHEHAEVGITERLGEYFEMKAIGRSGHEGLLLIAAPTIRRTTRVDRTMEVHPNLTGSVVDVDVRRRQMPALCPRRIPKAIAPSIC